jgi:hypothetical protein
VIYQELKDLAKIEKLEDEPRNRFIHRLLIEIDKLSDDKFETLSKDAQEYFNTAVKAHNDKKDLPEFPDEEKQETHRQKKYSKSKDDAVIRLLVDHNPKRKNSRSYEEFNRYKDGMTIKEFIKVGGHRASIRWDVNKGFIKLEQTDE